MNILFTDKTGTLTHGKLEVVGVITGIGDYKAIENKKITGRLVPGDGKGGAAGAFDVYGEVAKLLSVSLRYNTAAEISRGRAVGGNSTDRILLEFAEGLHNAQLIKYRTADIKKLRTVPFNSTQKFMSTAVSWDGAERVLYKGAPEIILRACTKYYNERGAARALDDKASIYRMAEELSAKAIRLVAVAVAAQGKGQRADVIGDNLTLVGLVAIRDRVRKEAYTSVARLKSAGIQTVMITGDAPATAMAVAREVGILKGHGSSAADYELVRQQSGNRYTLSTDNFSLSNEVVLTSDEVAGMSDRELAEVLPRLRVVARALPSDKSRLVRVAQSLNLVCGMTGDGVNDAPALKKADIGFAMGSGTEVAKEAGDIVIMDDNINSISRAVSYGRTIFKSIRKFLIFKLTINFCAMSTCIIAPLLSIDTPITVIQMLWINLVMDTLAGLAFGGERPREKYMTEPPKRRDEPIINRYMWQQILIMSVFTALASLWFLTSDLVQGHFAARGGAYAMTAFFLFFMLINIFNSFNTRTHELSPLSYLSLNKPFLWIMAAVTTVQVSMVYMGGSVFRTVALSFADFLIVVALAFAVIPVDMIRKAWVNRKGVVAGT
jgi:magnesium-transporting ATPase (P-type)